MKHLLTILLAFALSAVLQAQTATDSVPGSPLVTDQIGTGVAKPDSVTATPAVTETPSGPTVTPVDVDDEKPRTVLHYYDKHGEPLDEPVLFLATLDTVQKVRSKPIYPLYNGLNVGVNFGDAIFIAAGQRYGSFDLWANVSLHNWFFPTIECGLGYANDTPEKSNFTYRTSPSFYAKLGLNYNFLYKSNPDYQVFLGVRAGFSSFSYDVTDISITSDYWNETQNLSLRGLRSTSFYGEALAGLQVKIVGNFSLGWTARWHFNMHTSADGDNRPWFIPGYGGASPISMTVSAIWTIPAKKKEKDAIPETP